MTTELATVPLDTFFFDESDGTVLTWLGSAGVLLNARGTILLIDPVIACIEHKGKRVSETGMQLRIPLPIEAEQLPRADAVLYTHADGDHFGRRTVEILEARLHPRFIAPPPVASRLVEAGVEPGRVTVAEARDVHRIEQAEVLVTPALHDWQPENPWRYGDCCGFVVRTPEGAVWHPGDTRLIDELLAIRDVDVLLFDVAQARAHLGPEGSARLAGTCGARHLIAYHYGTFDVPPGGPFGCDPEESRALVDHLAAELHVLNPGEPFSLTRPSQWTYRTPRTPQ